MRGVKKENEKRVAERLKLARELRDKGLTYEYIGRILRVSRQGAHQLVKNFERHKEKIENEILAKPFKYSRKENQWSKYCDCCRGCGTTVIRHMSYGYCKKCYPKTENYKEAQKRSRLKNMERWREYSKKYSKRPEIVIKRATQLSLKSLDGNRELAVLRDKERCQFCGLTREESRKKHNRDLNVAHVNDSRDNCLKNLLTLCNDCLYYFMTMKKEAERDKKKEQSNPPSNSF